jgi:hypothetical protein
MITRGQMRRQLRAKGGIMNVASGSIGGGGYTGIPMGSRTGFGIISKIKDRVRKLIPNEIANVASKAAPFVAPFYPGAAALMRGIGRFDKRGSFSDAIKQGLGTFAFGKAAGYLGGAQSDGGIFGGQTFSKQGFSEGPVGRLFQGGKEKLLSDGVTTGAKTDKGVGFIKKGTEMFKDVPILRELPNIVQQQILVGGATAAGSYIYQKFLADEPPQDEGETMEEYLARRKQNVGNKMRTYFDNYFKFDPEYSALDDAGKDAFVARYNLKKGGRVGYQTGGITMANTLAENIRRNIANQAAFQQAINPSKQKIVERLQARQQEPSMMSQVFSGPAFDKYSAERTRAYTESPSRLQYNLDSNKAAGQFIQDKSKEIFGDNILGKGAGVLATAASVPLAAAITPFHEAAQVVAEDRIKPVSEYSGDVANFTRAFLAEKPLLTAAQRAGGVLQSIPVVGDAVTKAGEGIYDAVQSGKDSTGLEDYLEGTEAATLTPDAGPKMVDGVSQEGIIPGFVKRRSEFYNADGTPNQEKIKAANFIPGSSPSEFYYERIGEEGGFGPETYSRIVAGQYPDIYDPNKTLPVEPQTDQDLIEGFAKFKEQNPDAMSGAGMAALVEGVLPGGAPITFSGSTESNAFNKYLESLGLSRANIVKPRENIESLLKSAKLAKGGMPTGIMRSNQAGVMERDYRDEGGFVPVGIKEKADDVPAMLSKNEFVMTANAVRGAGNGSIEKGAQKMYDTMKKLEKRVV